MGKVEGSGGPNDERYDDARENANGYEQHAHAQPPEGYPAPAYPVAYPPAYSQTFPEGDPDKPPALSGYPPGYAPAPPRANAEPVQDKDAGRGFWQACLAALCICCCLKCCF